MSINMIRINTKPENDPFNSGNPTRTILWLRHDIIGVDQEYRTGSTSQARFHGIELSWHIPEHPSEADVRQWLEENISLFETISAGQSEVWDGSNYVGRLSDEARAASEEIDRQLYEDDGIPNYWSWWTLDSWLETVISQVQPDSSDEDLANFAQEWEPNKENVIIGNRSILEYIKERREQLQYDADPADFD